MSAEAQAGGDARRAGLPRSANPHREGSDARDRWDLAWLIAETDSLANLRTEDPPSLALLMP